MVTTFLPTSSYNHPTVHSANLKSRDISVGIANRLRANKQDIDSRQRQPIFLFPVTSAPALEATQSRTQWVPAVLSPGAAVA
jgi:hypothetical protein